MDAERWLEIAGYDGDYLVSDTGLVKSIKRKAARILRPNTNQGGYEYVVLCRGGVTTTWSVHRLVAETFLPPDTDRPFVNHLDGAKLNNRADNLEWCTHGENQAHASRTGLMPTKLSVGDLDRIVEMYSEGMTQGAIALVMGVSQRHVSGIVRGTERKHTNRLSPEVRADGIYGEGERHRQARLTESAVRQIRNSHRSTWPAIAEQHGVTMSACEAANERRSWKHI